MHSSYDILLAQHCGAVFLQKKPAALITITSKSRDLLQLQKTLKRSGLQLLSLRKVRTRQLLLIYHPAMLSQQLSCPIAKKTLSLHGYPLTLDLPRMLQHLKKRFAMCDDFPHEVGFFLDYPSLDVVGFLQHKGKDAKHTCKWKVYDDVKKAEALCAAYDTCQKICLQHIMSGGTFSSLTNSVQTAAIAAVI